MTLAAQPKNSGIDLLELANHCDYNPEEFAPLFKAIREKIQKFDPENKFGEYLDGHLQRVRSEMESFMLHRGYGEQAARIIGDAYALHDLGKIAQDPIIWKLTVEKPERSDFANTERPKHTELGAQALGEIMKEIGFEATPKQEKFLVIARYLMLYHHERPDGTGPRGMGSDMVCPILNMAIAVDTKDGKEKAKKDLRQIINDLKVAPERYDAQTAAHYEDFLTQSGKLAPNPPQGLAFHKVS